VVDEDENFSHGWLPLSAGAGSDELLGGQELGEPGAAVALVGEIWPCWRGGRLVNDSTFVHAASSPTCEVSTPRSDSDHVSTGFFFAAMMPLKEG